MAAPEEPPGESERQREIEREIERERAPEEGERSKGLNDKGMRRGREADGA